MTNQTVSSESILTKKQVKMYGPKKINYHGEKATITAEVRYDDECSNGHNSFAITGTIRSAGPRKYRGDDGVLACGCIHDEVAQHFPELAPFIKWHLTSSDAPMHYVANAVYHASDRDHSGRVKGEASAWEYGVRFNGVPVTHRLKKSFFEFLKTRKGTGDFQVFAIAHDNESRTSYKFADHYSFVGYAEKWHECPFNDKTEADEFCSAMNGCKVEFVKVATEWSSGKERDLDAARSCAVWPDATDEELMAPGLKERLEARLPAIQAEFRTAVESLGFTW